MSKLTYLAIALIMMETDALICAVGSIPYRPLASAVCAAAWPVTAPITVLAVIFDQTKETKQQSPSFADHLRQGYGGQEATEGKETQMNNTDGCCEEYRRLKASADARADACALERRRIGQQNEAAWLRGVGVSLHCTTADERIVGCISRGAWSAAFGELRLLMDEHEGMRIVLRDAVRGGALDGVAVLKQMKATAEIRRTPLPQTATPQGGTTPAVPGATCQAAMTEENPMGAAPSSAPAYAGCVSLSAGEAQALLPVVEQALEAALRERSSVQHAAGLDLLLRRLRTLCATTPAQDNQGEADDTRR